MKPAHAIWASWLSFLLYCSALQTASRVDETTRLAQLDKFWSEVQAAVQTLKSPRGWEQGFLDSVAHEGVTCRWSLSWGQKHLFLL